MVRTAKRQLKEDKLISTTAEASFFLKKHWKNIVSIAAGVLIILGLWFLYYKYTSIRNEKASLSLKEAEILFTDAESVMESTGDRNAAGEKYEKARVKFDEVSKKSGHSYTISKALFYSAKCSYQLGRYDEAISTFQKVIDKHSGSVFALYSRKGIARAYEQLADDASLRKAIVQYDKLSESPETYFALTALIDKGRCLEGLKEWDEAIGSYNMIVEKFKKGVDLAIQDRSKELVQKAKDVISKYEAALGKDQSNPDFVNLVNKAKAFEKIGQEQWFEALKAYDEAIFSRKQYWAEQKVSRGYDKEMQEASDALNDYENQAGNTIKSIDMGLKSEKENDWESSLKYYFRSIRFNFMPGMDMYQKVQSRIDWINSVEKAG